jgi:uncharacterized membrane protein
MFIILNVIFVIYIVLLFLMAEQLFKSAKGQGLKDGSRILVKVFSLLMATYIFLLQIPLVTAQM